MVLEFKVQRRKLVRYKLRLPVLFHWNDGIQHTHGGFTNDVALDGVMILSSKCPPVDSDIRVEILLPAPDGSDQGIQIECIGTVTRVIEQRGYSAFGVSVIFDDTHLMRHAVL